MKTFLVSRERLTAGFVEKPATSLLGQSALATVMADQVSSSSFSRVRHDGKRTPHSLLFYPLSLSTLAHLVSSVPLLRHLPNWNTPILAPIFGLN